MRRTFCWFAAIAASVIGSLGASATRADDAITLSDPLAVESDVIDMTDATLVGFESSKGDLGGCGCESDSGKGDCGCGGGSCLSGLLNRLTPSDTCFGDFISPMTNPVFFEDPRTLTEARFIYLNHQVPTGAGGGEVNLIAMQLRAALSENLSLIATKDGYATSTNPLIDDGWADVNIGLKYNLLCDPICQQILSAGITYELPVGTPRTLQGNGDGLFHLFLTGGRELSNGAHVISASGFLLPADSNAESQIWYWSNHIDQRIGDTDLYVLGEMNWYHYLKSGAGGIPGVEGGDLFNFGSTGVAGNDIVTGAVGIKYAPSSKFELGVAYEEPLTQRSDILQRRLTVDAIFRY